MKISEIKFCRAYGYKLFGAIGADGRIILYYDISEDTENPGQYYGNIVTFNESSTLVDQLLFSSEKVLLPNDADYFRVTSKMDCYEEKKNLDLISLRYL